MILSGRKRGSVLVIAALSMTVLLSVGALAVDYGYAVLMRERLQRRIKIIRSCISCIKVK